MAADSLPASLNCRLLLVGQSRVRKRLQGDLFQIRCKTPDKQLLDSFLEALITHKGQNKWHSIVLQLFRSSFQTLVRQTGAYHISSPSTNAAKLAAALSRISTVSTENLWPSELVTSQTALAIKNTLGFSPFYSPRRINVVFFRRTRACSKKKVVQIKSEMICESLNAEVSFRLWHLHVKARLPGANINAFVAAEQNRLDNNHMDLQFEDGVPIGFQCSSQTQAISGCRDISCDAPQSVPDELQISPAASHESRSLSKSSQMLIPETILIDLVQSKLIPSLKDTAASLTAMSSNLWTKARAQRSAQLATKAATYGKLATPMLLSEVPSAKDAMSAGIWERWWNTANDWLEEIEALDIDVKNSALQLVAITKIALGSSEGYSLAASLDKEDVDAVMRSWGYEPNDDKELQKQRQSAQSRNSDGND